MMAAHQKRYFEFKDEKSAKFWEVSFDGGAVTVSYGKIGAAGQSQIKEFADVGSASKHANKLVAEKVGKGYVELGSSTPPEPLESAEPVSQPPGVKLTRAGSRKPAASNPARDPDASPQVLLGLMGKDDATDRLLAVHPKADSKLLERLSHSSDSATRRSVAKNPNTPQQAFVRLGQQFPKEFLANPMLDLLLLENPTLMEQVPGALLVRLLKQADCPVSLLTWASAQPQAKVQLAAAMNPSAGLEAKERLRQSQHPAVREAAQPDTAGVGQDPEMAFEHAVRERLGSISRLELDEAWQAGDIGLAQWNALPLAFRLNHAASHFWSGELAAVVRLISELGWTLDQVQARLPGFVRWVEIARFPATAAPVLKVLAGDKDAGVRQEVAANPNTAVPVLEELAKNVAANVRKSVAMNRNTPASVLKTLARDGDEAVRGTVAWNPNSPVRVLEELAKDHHKRVRAGVAENMSAPAHVFEMLGADRDESVRRRLACNPRTPGPMLEALAKDGDSDVRKYVAENPGSSSSALYTLSTDSRASVRMAVAKSPACPASVLDALIEDADLEVLKAVAQSRFAPAHVLEAMFQKGSSYLYYRLASNPVTPIHVLEELSRLDGPLTTWIQVEVALHPSLPEGRRRDLLEALSKRPSEGDRSSAAQNPAMPSSALETLSSDSKSSVRRAVASNLQCPPEVLTRLAKDGSAVQEELARNPNTPLEVLVELAASKFPQVRKKLAVHAHRSAELRRKLGADPDEDIRAATASCPGLTAEMLDELLQGYQLEGDLMALFVHPNLRTASAQAIANKLFNTPAAQSPWFLQEMAKATEDVQAAAKAGSVLAYFGKDPNKEVLAKRPLAAVMALCAGPYIEPARIVKVAGSTDWLVRAAVARCQDTPPNLLKKLSADVHPLVAALARQSLVGPESAKASNGATSDVSAPLNLERALAEILRRLRGEGFGWSVTPLLNSAAWRDRARLDEVLSWLKRFEEFDAWVQSLLAELDVSQRDCFWLWAAGARDGEVRMRLVQHPAAPFDALERFSADPSAAVLIAVAAKSELPKALRSKVEKAALRAIMGRGASFREQMALHAAAAPTFVQERLARDENRVRQFLGVTSAFPDWMTRDWSSGSHGAGSKDLGVDDPDLDSVVGSNAYAAVRKRLTLEWMECLRQAFHREVLVRQGEPPPTAAPLTTADMLGALAWLDCVPASDKAVPTKPSRSSDWLSRLGAALHPAASEAILNLLRQDADPDVAAAAQLRANTTTDETR